MDDVKFFARSKNELKTQIETAGISRQDIEMKLEIEKGTNLAINIGKRKTTEGIGIPIQETSKYTEEKKRQISEDILETVTI